MKALVDLTRLNSKPLPYFFLITHRVNGRLKKTVEYF